jgi:hypothetical protein
MTVWSACPVDAFVLHHPHIGAFTDLLIRKNMAALRIEHHKI